MSSDKSVLAPSKGSYFWNSLGGMLNAGQSVLCLMVIQRTLGLEASGIYAIAFATGNLFLYLGNYGVRNYQVSDLSEKYCFGDYLVQRLLTVALMLVLSAGFVLYSLRFSGYSAEKAWITVLMCVLKAVDCLEEVFEGRFHQRGRLDLSGKLMSGRLVLSIGGMLLALVLGKGLAFSVAAAIVLAVLANLVLLLLWKDQLGTAGKAAAGGILGITKACFPVCAANFLQFYLINAPKYAIDSLMDETAQARYSFIAMPVFVIQLMNLFLYQPVLGKMTIDWQNRDRKGFLGSVRRILLGLLALSVFVLLGGYLLGIPVLGILYAADLTDLRGCLMGILAGSVFLALSGFLCAVLTIARRQNSIPLVFFAGSAVSLFVTPRMVSAFGIGGAVASFAAVQVFVCLALTLLFLRSLRHLAAEHF